MDICLYERSPRTHAHLCLMRPNSSPSSTWPLGLKSNSKAGGSDYEICILKYTRVQHFKFVVDLTLEIIDHINHLVSVQPAPPPSPGSHLQLAEKRKEELTLGQTSQKISPQMLWTNCVCVRVS